MSEKTIQVSMERQTRDGAAKLFSELGISTTQAINMFLKQAVREQGIPFEVTARPAIEHGGESMEKQAPCPSRRPPQRPCS
ncbi:type II toxin-antitoxin system RelB/DinJ family antitoxin [Ellagibacter isourolithinifaciens]|uniref:type II toxin-antitoxin system RelB/DinJ family antitoxin n=1 Tax=Ellagibacter isourolithinifaciens TaxID=2137581 RepID=UPI0024844E9D|nr:type II toxin-antitoxin system RelB/DinJ family antitoxin [Ellagibacter isourolithinifaciens]